MRKAARARKKELNRSASGRRLHAVRPSLWKQIRTYGGEKVHWQIKVACAVAYSPTFMSSCWPGVSLCPFVCCRVAVGCAGNLFKCKCLRARVNSAQYDPSASGSGSAQASDGTLATASSDPLPKEGSGSLQDVVRNLPGKSRVTPATEATDEISPTTRDLRSRARARGAIPLEVVFGVSSQHDVRVCVHFVVTVIAMPSDRGAVHYALFAWYLCCNVGGTRHPWRELAPQAERCARGAAIAIPPV